MSQPISRDPGGKKAGDGGGGGDAEEGTRRGGRRGGAGQVRWGRSPAPALPPPPPPPPASSRLLSRLPLLLHLLFLLHPLLQSASRLTWHSRLGRRTGSGTFSGLGRQARILLKCKGPEPQGGKNLPCGVWRPEGFLLGPGWIAGGNRFGRMEGPAGRRPQESGGGAKRSRLWVWDLNPVLMGSSVRKGCSRLPAAAALLLSLLALALP